MAALSVALNSSLDTVGISAANASELALTKATIGTGSSNSDTSTSDSSTSSSTTTSSTNVQISSKARELSAADQRRVQELKQIDAEVRAHEQAHMNAGRGIITSGPSYTYTDGPDGKQYAVAGEVGIDTSPESKPQQNIDKGARIQAAALAPIQPSPQDQRVAAVGSELEAKGRSDLSAELRAQQIEADKLAEEQRQSSLSKADATSASDQAQAADQAAASPPAPSSETSRSAAAIVKDTVEAAASALKAYTSQPVNSAGSVDVFA
ncbi:MAG TPA: putative metalloprotease CJM1_0395 family protein [Rhodocyclaceae bacterium]|jgi:hypothetical protein|nr:putative metalloprotease CJM1_0395 family protein [Rhodocyclaceae bacterium]